MLLTRLPLRIATALDLHVLSLPPAFALSQDQTLKFDVRFGSITTFDESQARAVACAIAWLENLEKRRTAEIIRLSHVERSGELAHAKSIREVKVRKDSAARVSLSSRFTSSNSAGFRPVSPSFTRRAVETPRSSLRQKRATKGRFRSNADAPSRQGEACRAEGYMRSWNLLSTARFQRVAQT